MGEQWCWKADYWNLGAGAEIGIYYQNDPALANNGYYNIDTEHLNVHVCMNVKYKNVPITTDFVQTNWWITSFTPSVQSADVDLIDVEIKTAFVNSIQHGNLLPAFNAAADLPENTNKPEWALPRLEFFGVVINPLDPNYGYQFQIKY